MQTPEQTLDPEPQPASLEITLKNHLLRKRVKQRKSIHRSSVIYDLCTFFFFYSKLFVETRKLTYDASGKIKMPNVTKISPRNRSFSGITVPVLVDH